MSILGTLYDEKPRSCVRTPNATWQYGLTGVTAEPARPGPNALVPVVVVASSGRRARTAAVVGDGLTCAGSGGDGESLDRTDPDRDVDAVEVLIPVSVGGRIGDEVVDHARLLRHDIVQARDDVAAAIRQSRVDWRHDAEWRQIGRLQRTVVDEREPVDTSDGCR